jgi:predicted secreted protein
LNNASKVVSNIELVEENRDREALMAYIIENNIQLLQLPCPEFIIYGSKRWGHVKDQFVHPFYKKQCEILLEPILLQLEEYAAYPDQYSILSIISIGGSPSCGYHITCKGNWGGELGGQQELESKINSLGMEKEAGVFMEEFERLLKQRCLKIPIQDLSEFIRVINK